MATKKPLAIYSGSVKELQTGDTIDVSTSFANQSANQIFAGPVSGGAAAPAFRAQVPADLPTIALTGNVTGSAAGGSIATTIGNAVVTVAMMAVMAAGTIMGNSTGSPASPQALSASSARTTIGIAPVWDAMNTVDYVASYADLDAAITAIGSTTTKLRITSPTAIGANDFHANTTVEFLGDGELTGTNAITIYQMIDPGPRKVFPTNGTVLLGDNATGGHCHLEWWAGIAPTADISTAMVQAVNSMALSGGGVIHCGANTWKCKEITLVNGTIESVTVQGSGKYSTTFEHADHGSTAVFKATGAFRSGAIRDCTIRANGTANCIELSGTVPNSAFNFRTFSVRCTGSSTEPQIHLYDSGVGKNNNGSWECVQVCMTDSMFETSAANAIGIQFDSVNTKILIDGVPEFLGTTGYKPIRVKGGVQSLRVVHGDFRGTTPPVTVWTNRPYSPTMTGNGSNAGVSIAADGSAPYTGTLTVYGGVGLFNPSDVGQQVILTTSGGGSSQTLRVTGVGGYGTTATVVSASPISAINFGTATVKYGELAAAGGGGTGYACVHIEGGDYETISLIQCIDERFQNFLVQDLSKLDGKIIIKDSQPQSHIRLNASCSLLMQGNLCFSNTISTNPAGYSIIDLENNRTKNNSLYGFGDIEILESRMMGVNEFDVALSGVPLRGGVVRIDTDHKDGTPFLYYNQPAMFVRTQNAAGEGTSHPALAVGAIDDPANLNRPVFRYGRADFSDPTKLDFYYGLHRNNDISSPFAGWSMHTGNQGLNKGYHHDSLLRAETFVGGTITPAAITGPAHDYNPPNPGSLGDPVYNSAKYWRLSSTGAQNITGIALQRLPVDGQEHVLENIGAATITLKHNDGLSSAIYRLWCEGLVDIPVAAGEAASFKRDEANTRWSVRKLGGSGGTITLTGDVTGSGTTSIATTIANNAVTTAKILDANVTTAKINDAAVTTIKIADSNVTLAKIANIATGTILGNNSGSSAAPSALSGSAARTVIGAYGSGDSATLNVLTVTAIDTPFTAGSIIYAGTSGVLAEDNGDFFWDATNNRLGIRTGAAPAQALEIQSATGIQLRLGDGLSGATFNYDIGRLPTGGDAGLLNFYGNQNNANGYIFGGNIGGVATEFARLTSAGLVLATNLPMTEVTGTKAQFDGACSDGNFLYVGDVTSNATHTGDVTGATALTIANDAVTTSKILNSNVTLAKIANIATGTILGNNTGSSAAPVALSASSTRNLLGLGIADAPVFGGLTLTNASFHTNRGYLTRAIPTTGANYYIEIGTLAITHCAHSIRVSAVVAASSFSVAKQWDLVASYDATGGEWKIATPTRSSVYGPGGNDFDLDIKVDTTTVYLRLRRTAGSSTADAEIFFQNLGYATAGLVTSSGTGSTSAPGSSYP